MLCIPIWEDWGKYYDRADVTSSVTRGLMGLNEPAFHSSPEPRPLRYSRSVCKRDGLRRDAEDSWFWIGPPFASTLRLVSVGHKTRRSDILTFLRQEVVHICSFDFAPNKYELKIQRYLMKTDHPDLEHGL